MTWRDDMAAKGVEAFRAEVRRQDEAGKAAHRQASASAGPGRRNLPEGPGSRAARLRREEIERQNSGGEASDD